MTANAMVVEVYKPILPLQQEGGFGTVEYAEMVCFGVEKMMGETTLEIYRSPKTSQNKRK